MKLHHIFGGKILEKRTHFPYFPKGEVEISISLNFPRETYYLKKRFFSLNRDQNMLLATEKDSWWKFTGKVVNAKS